MSAGREGRKAERKAARATLSGAPVEREDCPCPKAGCALRGRCSACRAKHAPSPPRCER
jgi:hypothetical protein